MMAESPTVFFEFGYDAELASFYNNAIERPTATRENSKVDLKSFFSRTVHPSVFNERFEAIVSEEGRPSSAVGPQSPEFLPSGPNSPVVGPQSPDFLAWEGNWGVVGSQSAEFVPSEGNSGELNERALTPPQVLYFEYEGQSRNLFCVEGEISKEKE